MCQIQVSNPVSATSQRVKAGPIRRTVAQEMEIFLPWKKFDLPDPLAPTAKTQANRNN
jgi:hypothetical protein